MQRLGDMGVVFSVRDKEEKKIAHNVTVMNKDDAEKYRKIFNEEFYSSKKLNNVNVINEIVE